jgi:transposase
MITLPASVRIYLAAGAIDLRKSIDGLGALVTERGHDVYSGYLYVFTSRRGDRIKILTWDHGGFVLYYKRLEAGRFRLPEVRVGQVEVELEATQLAMLLDGIDVKRVKPPRRWTPPTREKSAARSATSPDLPNA